MKYLTMTIVVVAALAFFWLLPQPAPAKSETSAPRFAITDVRVFDGGAMHENWTVLVAGGRIEAAGAEVEVPDGYQRIEAAGKTLLPGLTDAHVHAFGHALEQALNFGVTAVLDMFTSPALLGPAHERRASLGPQDKADMFSAGVLATAPGGHGTEYGMDIPTVRGPDEAGAFVEARIAQGSDYIKIVYNEHKGRFPSIDEKTMRALVDAAHEHDLMAVVHVSNLDSARAAIQAGADGLVHVFADEIAGEAFIALIKQSGAFVIPTLSVLESVAGISGAENLLQDKSFAPYLTSAIKAQLEADFGSGRGADYIERAKTNVRALHAAGVPILAGTDAPNPGTAYGVSLHHELFLLTGSGLSNTEALAAATSTPARQFGLQERGRIAPGMIADLVLVEGNPAEHIQATRNIVQIWKDGYPVERTTVAEMKRGVPPAPEDAFINNFDGGEQVQGERITAAFGYGWQVTTDDMRGGKSAANMEIVSGGAQDTAGALAVSGEIKAGFPFPWAGVIFFPGAAPMQPVNFSGKSELVFWTRTGCSDSSPAGPIERSETATEDCNTDRAARGAPTKARTIRVMLFSGAGMGRPAIVTVEATGEWQKVVLPFAQFQGADTSTLRGIAWVAGPEPDAFNFMIDEVAVR